MQVGIHPKWPDEYAFSLIDLEGGHHSEEPNDGGGRASTG